MVRLKATFYRTQKPFSHIHWCPEMFFLWRFFTQFTIKISGT